MTEAEGDWGFYKVILKFSMVQKLILTNRL